MEEQGKGSVLGRVAVMGGIVLVAAAAIFFMAVPQCIRTGTLVETPVGPRAIESLRVGDVVFGRAPSGEFVPCRVAAVSCAWALGWKRLTLADGRALEATGAHPVLTTTGWRRVDQLAGGDRCLTADGELEIVAVESVGGLTSVYDLTVEPHANFLASGIVVHNKTSQISRNENMAAALLRSYGAEQASYRAAHGAFAATLAELGAADPKGAASRMAEAVGAASAENGYYFVAQPQSAPKEGAAEGGPFPVLAVPAEYDGSGVRTFFAASDGTVYGKNCGPEARNMAPADPASEGWDPED